MDEEQAKEAPAEEEKKGGGGEKEENLNTAGCAPDRLELLLIIMSSLQVSGVGPTVGNS